MAEGFQKEEKPQSVSHMVAQVSLKLLIALALNEDFELALMDIRAAFLLSKTLDRDVFMKPSED